MGFMEILMEAKRKEKPKKSEALNVDVEKDETDGSIEEAPEEDEAEAEATDYSDEEESSDDDTTTDYEETDYEEPSEDEGTDYGDVDGEEPVDGEESNDGEEPVEDEGTDYGDPDAENGEESTDEPIEDEQADNDVIDEKKELSLLVDFSNLYQMIVETLNKLNNSTTLNLITNQVITQVTKNLNVARDLLYDYTVLDYSSDSHAERLRQYSYFLEAVKINVNMLKKVSTSFSLGETK